MSDVQVRVRLPKGMADSFQQVCLAQSDCTVDYQGIERGARRLSHLLCRRMGQAISWPRHEVIKSPRRTARRPEHGMRDHQWEPLACVLEVVAYQWGEAIMAPVGLVPESETKAGPWG